jgi:2-keto-4-pentenoate hydratase/2-oxohepta-3-ene-1,7-dioic acid hydratase in catechol pathway
MPRENDMKLIIYDQDEQLRLGVFGLRGVLDVFTYHAATGANAKAHHLPTTVSEFYADGLAYVPALQHLLSLAEQHSGVWWVDERHLTVAPVVPAPGKIVCVGLNYRRHAIETGMDIPRIPILFSKFSNAIAACGEVVALPPEAAHYDYEAELIVVMGRRAERVSVEEALTYVLGYCNGNDISARDLQLKTSQWLLGKTLNRFLPIGPYLVTNDEITDPQGLVIKGWLNSDLRQNSNTGDMIFTVAEIISYISGYFALEPGDIIATGTPEGVIFGHANPQWMKKGDRFVVEIEGLGRLENELG